MNGGGSTSSGGSTAGADGSAVRVDSRDVLLETPKFNIERLGVVWPGGRHQPVIARHPGAVCILPLRDDGRIVFIRNWRPSVERWVWELPAGTLEAGEDPGLCAGRELIEETGYESAHIQPLCAFLTTPGLTDERMHAFVATQLTPVGAAPEHGEHIRVEALTVEELWARVDTGGIDDGKTLVTLFTAARRGVLAAGGADGQGAPR